MFRRHKTSFKPFNLSNDLGINNTVYISISDAHACIDLFTQLADNKL
jgi:hypothetical protein